MSAACRVLRSQMQNAVDARAMAAAAQLDGRDGARDAPERSPKTSCITAAAMAADEIAIEIKAPVFYSQYTPTKIAGDERPGLPFVEVVLEARQVDLLFGPVLDMLAGNDSNSSPHHHLCRGRAGPLHLPCAAADDLRLRR